METPPVASGESEASNVPSNESQFHLNRPEGRDKQKRKKKETVYPSDAAWERRLDELVANSQEHTRLARERDEREKARDARDKRKNDMGIMMMDISQVSPRSPPWFQAQKDAILASPPTLLCSSTIMFCNIIHVSIISPRDCTSQRRPTNNGPTFLEYAKCFKDNGGFLLISGILTSPCCWTIFPFPMHVVY
ncbi:hypothetical protein LINPERHAP2_LOCUS3558 [Linum perenne]